MISISDEAGRLADACHRGGRYWYTWRVPGRLSTWLRVGEYPHVSETHDVYFGVNPTHEPRAADERSRNTDVAAIASVIAEFDAKDFDGDKSATLAYVEGLPVTPSVLVDSGGGYHAYWLLRDPFILDEEQKRERAKALYAAWVAYVKGDPNAKDLARVLRVPGTWNHKYDPPRPVAFVRAEWERLYSLPDLETACTPKSERILIAQTKSEPNDEFWLNKALEKAQPGNRNATGFALACQLRDAGLTEIDATAVMRRYAVLVPGPGYAESEALASLGQAYGISPREPARRNGDDGNGHHALIDTSGADKDDNAVAAPSRRITSEDLIQVLTALGYTFRVNKCDDSLEVNGERMSDVTRAAIRSQLRDLGYGKYLAAAEDAVLAHAGTHAYHPVRDYLAGLTWDGQWHISRLAGHFQDTNQIFGAYLRHWLIGAVARAHTGAQNAVLVLDGAQGIGKSLFARWLCPLPGMFLDGGIDPDSRDAAVLAMRSWIWEVSELGATTRRADVEALKAFLSREVFTVRPAYGHFDITKPALASFIGTVNNSAGIFSDPTGSRRFWATTLTAIDWKYRAAVDIGQVWAEAHAAYLSGEDWRLSPDEATWAREINQSFEAEDPIENLLRKHFRIEPHDGSLWTSTADILLHLQTNGLQGNTKANQMALSATLKRLCLVRGERAKQRGYFGITLT